MRPAREKLWVVRAGDGTTVADIVRRIGEDPVKAVAEGRVFVGKRRVSTETTKVAVGDAVKVGAAAGRNVQLKGVLFVKDGMAATIKPAGIPTVPDHAGAAHSWVASVARELGRDPASLHVTSRLDREVSGVVVFALEAAAAERLKRARDEGAYARRYVALAFAEAGALAEEGSWDAPIGAGKDARHRAAFGADAKASRTRFRVVARLPLGEHEVALLAVDPETGRTHQIRVHASHAGAPLLGDRDYGGPLRLTTLNGQVLGLGRIALHAARVMVPGAAGASVVAEASIPDELRRVWAELGGAPEAWNTALS